MTCPKCSSNHTMSTTKKESTLVRYRMGVTTYAHTERESKAVTHRCLDCGYEWERGDEE